MSEFNYIEYLRNNPLTNRKKSSNLIKENLGGKTSPKLNEEDQWEDSEDDNASFNALYSLFKQVLQGSDEEVKQYVQSLDKEISKDSSDYEGWEMDDYIEDFNNYIADKSLEETETETSKSSHSDLKARIKETIIGVLSEADDEEEDVDVEDVEVEDEEVELEDEGEDLGGGDSEALDPEAGLTQDEQDIQNALKVAYDNAIALGDDKLSKQIGNTITMFTRTRVVGDLNENSDNLPVDSEIPGGEVGKFYDYLLKDYVIDFDGKYLDNGDFKPGFKKVKKADEDLEEIIDDLKDRGLTLKDLPTEWTKVNTYEGQANTKYDKYGDELYHYEVEIYQFVKFHNNKLMTAEVVSKPLRKVTS